MSWHYVLNNGNIVLYNMPLFQYLNDTVGDFVRTIIETEDDCEVDPTRVVSPTILPMQQTNLRMYCDMVWTKIITSSSFFPR